MSFMKVKSSVAFFVFTFFLFTSIGFFPAMAGMLGLETSPLTQPGITFGKKMSPYLKSTPVPSSSKTNDALLTTKQDKAKTHGHPKKKDEEIREGEGRNDD